MRLAARVLRLVAAGCSACIFFSALAHEPHPAELWRESVRSVFRVEATDAGGQTTRGSGVLVAPHTIVTSCHVVLNAHDIVLTSTAARQPAQLVRAHVERDLCLLDARGVDGTPVALGATGHQAVGRAITAVGFPGGGALSVSRGRIEGLYRYDGAGRVVQGSAAFGAGNSGGALFDEAGQLIGVLTFKARAGGPFHFAVPAEWVSELLNHAAAPGNVAGAKPFWQRPREQQPTFLRAASLAASGDCAALNQLATEWLAREPGNAEAQLVAIRAQRCGNEENPPRPLLEQLLAALRG